MSGIEHALNSEQWTNLAHYVPSMLARLKKEETAEVFAVQNKMITSPEVHVYNILQSTQPTLSKQTPL